MVVGLLGQRCWARHFQSARPLQEHEGRDEKGFGDRDEVVDVAAPLGTFDSGQHRVGHRTAKGRDTVGQLTLGETAFGTEDFDGVSGPYSCRTHFQRTCCHSSSCSVHSPVWLTGDRRLCCARLVSEQGEIPVPTLMSRDLAQTSRCTSDVGCCVVASPSQARQRLPDVMLLARSTGQLFGQPAIVPYGFAPARYQPDFLRPFCRERLRRIGLDLRDLGVAMLTTPAGTAVGSQRTPRQQPDPSVRIPPLSTVSRGVRPQATE